MRYARSRFSLVVVALAALLLGGCVIATPTVTPGDGMEAGVTVQDATYVATEHTFNGPDTLTAGWTRLTLVNEGAEPHHMYVLQLDEGKTIEDVFAALQSEEIPDWISFYGGVMTLMPGQSGSMVINLPPGNYIALCFIPNAEGVPHAALGMVQAITVTGTASEAMLEMDADATIELHDFAFVHGTLTAGEQTLKVTNTGHEPHEMALFKLDEGMSLADIQPYFGPDAPEGPPPFQEAGGVAPIQPGATVYVPVNLEAGTYVALCFITSPANAGAPHLALGMITEIVVE